MLEDFKIRAGEFEGPLDLLLDLVEKRKLHVSQVSLSQVADDFIEHTKNFEEFPIKDSADFLLIASTLLLIKSKSLLPTLDLSTEESQNIEELEERLKKYKRYKELSKHINNLFGTILFFPKERKQQIVFSPSPEIQIAKLRESIDDILKNIPQKDFLPKISVAKIISLEEMIGKLSEKIEKNLKMSFHSFSSMKNTVTKEEKINVIISFLAMLELVKRGAMRVKQDKNFDNIEMETDKIITPNY